MRLTLATLAVASVLSGAHAQCLPTGRFMLEPTASYSCVNGVESWDVQTVRIVDLGSGQLSASALPGPLPAMAGTVDCGSSTFSVSGAVPGACMESWTIDAELDAAGNWTGTIEVNFFDSIPGLCLDCVDTQWRISGVRIDLPARRQSWAAVKRRF